MVNAPADRTGDPAVAARGRAVEAAHLGPVVARVDLVADLAEVLLDPQDLSPSKSRPFGAEVSRVKRLSRACCLPFAASA